MGFRLPRGNRGECCTCGQKSRLDFSKTGVPESEDHKISPSARQQTIVPNGTNSPLDRRKCRIPEKFGYIFRPKRWWELVLLSGTVCGIEFCYSAETAFVTPLLLSLGLSIRFVTMMWCLSPLIGFFLTPVLGSMSDTCEARIGRRRPFILLYSLGILIGLLFVPNGHRIGLALGDHVPVSNASSYILTNTGDDQDAVPAQPWSIAFTVMGTILLDFCSDACQAPSRTYLLDVSLPSDHSAGLSTFTLMAGAGGSLGYALGAIDWEQTLLGSWIGSQVDVVFFIVTLAFLICMVSSVGSFPEVPLSIFKDEKLNRAYQAALQAAKREVKNSNRLMDAKVRNYGSVRTREGRMKEDPNQEFSFRTPEENENSFDGFTNQNHQICIPTNLALDHHPKLKEYLKSIVLMPSSLKILCLTSLFSWMSLVCYTLYFTDFVAECVFGGDPLAPEDSLEYKLNQDGIRFGCWGLAFFSLSCAIYSYFIDFLVKKIGAKKIYIGGLLIFSLGMSLMAFTRSKLSVILLSPTAGVMQASLLTVPYLLIANYHSINQFTDKAESSPGVRGMGTDMATLSSMMFLAQLLLSLSIGSIVEAVGSNVATVCASAVLSGCGAVCATQILYLDI